LATATPSWFLNEDLRRLQAIPEWIEEIYDHQVEVFRIAEEIVNELDNSEVENIVH
jgi:hypothetical protein